MGRLIIIKYNDVINVLNNADVIYKCFALYIVEIVIIEHWGDGVVGVRRIMEGVGVVK